MFTRPLKTSSGGGGTDWSKYTLMSATGNVSNNTFTSVLSVTGKGFLNLATVCAGTSGNDRSDIRVTVDGTIVVNTGETNPSSTQYIAGISTQDNIKYSTTWNALCYDYSYSQIAYMRIGNFKNYPYTGASANGGIVVIPSNLFFKQSLLIEVKYTTGNSNAKYYLSYGVKS
jgi:hypothetical protein